MGSAGGALNDGAAAARVRRRAGTTAGVASPSPGGFFPIIRRWVVVIALSTGVALLVGYGVAQRMDPTYQARADLLVGPLNADIASVRAATAATETYAQLAEAPTTLDAVARVTGIDRGQLRSGLRVTSDPETRILSVRVRASTPEAAAAAANGVADHLVGLTDDDASNTSGYLRRIDVATPPSSSIGPSVEVITALAAAVGLFGGLALVMVLELLGDPAGSAADVRRVARVPVLSLPATGYRPGDVRSGEVVATHLALVRPGLRSVLFTGTSTFDGGGRLAMELAAAWAATSGQRVVVVDAGAGETTTVLGLDDRSGVSEALAGAVVAPTPLGGGVEALGSRRAVDGTVDADAPGRVVEDLVASGAAVVVHAPPLAATPATLAWARAVDATVLVSRRDTGRRGPLAQSADALRRVGADLALAVVHPGGRPGPLAAVRLAWSRPVPIRAGAGG